MSEQWEEYSGELQGTFIGWGDDEGQTVVGKVVDYDPVGGTNFGGDACPLVVVELTEDAATYSKKEGRLADLESGELVSVTAGLARLQSAVRRADPAAGDRIKIEHLGLVDIGNGKSVKDFSIKLLRGSKKGSKAAAKTRPVAAVPSGDDDEPPF